MLALACYQDDRCPGCGDWIPETTSPGSDELYDIEPPARCGRCDANARSAERVKDNPRPQALLHIVRRRTDGTPAQPLPPVDDEDDDQDDEAGGLY